MKRGQGALLHLKYLSKEEETKACEENDILVIQKADSLFGGKYQNHQVCTHARGREGSEKLRVGAYDVRIPGCLFKSKSQRGRAGNQMSQFRILVFEEIPQGSEGSGSEGRMSWRFCLSQGFGRMAVFHPGCSVKPRLFLLPVEIQTSGNVLSWN